MPADNLEVINRALTLLGEPKLANLAGTDDTTLTVTALYEPLVVMLFSMAHWRFARTRVALVEDVASPPINEWTRAFTLPTLNTLRCGPPIAFYASTAINARPTTEFELIGARAETNHTELYIEYIARKTETLWPEAFATLVAYALASQVAQPITEKTTLADALQKATFGLPSEGMRGGFFRVAAQSESWGDPSNSVFDASDPIADSRWG